MEEEVKKNNNIKKIIVSLTICILAGLGIYFGSNFYNDYNDVKNKLSRTQSELSSKETSITKLKSEIRELEDTISKNENQIDFMDKYVAICPTDGSGLFHKYNCEHLDTSTFTIFNVVQAKKEGYSPCKYCEKDTKVKASKKITVYVTNTGTKYHREWCSYLKSKNPITKDKAIEERIYSL